MTTAATAPGPGSEPARESTSARSTASVDLPLEGLPPMPTMRVGEGAGRRLVVCKAREQVDAPAEGRALLDDMELLRCGARCDNL
jgi:hypothetical protein